MCMATTPFPYTVVARAWSKIIKTSNGNGTLITFPEWIYCFILKHISKVDVDHTCPHVRNFLSLFMWIHTYARLYTHIQKYLTICRVFVCVCVCVWCEHGWRKVGQQKYVTDNLTSSLLFLFACLSFFSKLIPFMYIDVLF